MSKHSDLASHVSSLEEIKDIITAMKNLAILEMHRVTKLQENQKHVMDTLKRIAEDFFHFYPFSSRKRTHYATPKPGPASSLTGDEIWIVIGSERGFCGGFNEAILGEMETSTPFIAVGRKLHSKLGDAAPLMEILDGPSAVEEIDSIVTKLIQSMANYPGSRWIFAHNEDDGNRLEQRIIRPFEMLSSASQPVPERGHPEGYASGIEFTSAPLLETDPDSFQIQLMDQYLFALLYEAFYLSFFAENRQRLRHLESAVSRIENELERLRLKMNALRQDEITEEIEVILLSVGMDEFA